MQWQQMRGFGSAGLHRRPVEAWGRTNRPMRAAWVALAVVLILPVILLIFAAIVVAVIVFTVLSMLDALAGVVRRAWAQLTGGASASGHRTNGPGSTRPPWGDDGRRNVRVIR